MPWIHSNPGMHGNTALIGGIAAATFLFSLLATGFYRSFARKRSIMDIPNDRSSHSNPTPRGGGVVFVLLWIAAMSVLAVLGAVPPDVAQTLVPPVALAAAVGFSDDLFKLSAKTRFGLQLAAAALLLWGLGGYERLAFGGWSLELGMAGNLFALLWIVWSVNLFNFMDGTDGIASVEAAVVMGAGGVFLWLAGGQGYAAAALFAVAGVAGFFYWNRPKAKLFMGDAGSYFLGFLIAALALAGEAKLGVPLMVWVILYAVFWMDATVTLVRRAAIGKKWYEAHRTHAYQRLVQAGWSHGRVAAGVTGLNAVLCVMAALAYAVPSLQVLMLVLAVAGLGTLYWKVERIFPMR